MIAWLAPRLARAVFALAVTLLLLAIAAVALGLHVAGWPYRRLSGPSRQRAMFESGLAAAAALGAFLAALRGTGPAAGCRSGRGPGL